jgi:hypothetical protein
MKNPILISLLLTLFALNVQAQSNLSWRKHAKVADELFAKAKYADAAEHYRAAWKKKTKKKDLIFKAGESFFLVRDYRNAADAWQHVKDENEKYPLIGLRYARCLKQNGEYEAASAELVDFLGKYQGGDKATVSQIVNNELRGCELAAQLAVAGPDEGIVIEHLSSNVNTPETEFAPFPYGEEALYFSSTMGKRAEIYRSIKSGGFWSKAAPIENFPNIPEDHFCNGTLAPDASRFYFTICESTETWGGLTSQCAIYVTNRMGKNWSTPERLPAYINEVNTSSTHPYVIHEGDYEILYFASNRKGGIGGMDIWYTTRELKSTANDFKLPINAGSKVNTIGDEISPFYDQVEDQLYFASNGQVSIGGYDIFKVKGAKSQWSPAENLGLPINSSADDFFYVKRSSGKGGFLVSNRTFGKEKVATTDEDIFGFEFSEPVQHWTATGEVFDKSNKQVLPDVEVALYEVTNDNQRRFLDKIVSADGRYNFEVQPEKNYAIEVLKDGYYPNTYTFNTRAYAEYTEFGAPMYLEPYANNEGEEAVVESEPMEKVTVTEIIGAPKEEEPVAEVPTKRKETTVEVVTPESTSGKTASGGSSTDSLDDEPAGRSVYRIQIIALSKFNPEQSRYASVKKLGPLKTEYLLEKDLYRVMISGYDSISEAKANLPQVRRNRDFRDAFIVEYRNGKRIRTIH